MPLRGRGGIAAFRRRLSWPRGIAMGDNRGREEARARLEARRARSEGPREGAPRRPATARPAGSGRSVRSGGGSTRRPTVPPVRVQTQQYAVSSRGYRRSAGKRALVPVAAALAVLLVVFLLVKGCSFDEPDSAGEGAGSASSQGQVATKPSSSIPAGSVETIDENGIVHGTTPDGVSYTVVGRGVESETAGKVTLLAAGDQLATDNLLAITDAYAGEVGDGEYDFRPLYREVEPLVKAADIAFINQETVMASEEEYDYSGWPSFNTPEAAAAAISEVGFDLVNFATNHTYDYYTYGVEQSFGVWEKYPNLVVGGSYPTQADRETVHMIERDGMTFAFLAYCYGDNYLGTYENFPNQHYMCGFDKQAMEADIKRAQSVADAVIVAMHWGTEYVVEPNDQQMEYAKFLADLDVDLVLGTHAHIMQPVKYVMGDTGNTVPVVFGLSDFVSGWTTTNYILSGLFTCEFVRGEAGVEVSELTWYPTIEWSDGEDVYVRLLKDMDEATTNANTRTEDVDDDYTYLRDFVNASGMEIPVVM